MTFFMRPAIYVQHRPSPRASADIGRLRLSAVRYVPAWSKTVQPFMSFNEIVDTLNRQGHGFSFKQIPKEAFATSFPGAAEIAATLAYFEAHTYLGSDSRDRIALANRVAGRQPSKFSTWAQVNFPVQVGRKPQAHHD
jgi:hypothetical protein